MTVQLFSREECRYASDLLADHFPTHPCSQEVFICPQGALALVGVTLGGHFGYCCPAENSTLRSPRALCSCSLHCSVLGPCFLSPPPSAQVVFVFTRALEQVLFFQL